MRTAAASVMQTTRTRSAAVMKGEFIGSSNRRRKMAAVTKRILGFANG